MDTAVPRTVWPQILAAHGKIVQSLPPATREAMQALVQSYNVPPKYVFHLVYLAENYDATALSTEHVQTRDPFDHPDIVEAFWVGSIVAGFVVPDDDGTLRISEAGEAMRRERWRILNDGLAGLNLVPDETLAVVNGLLERVVAETAVSTAPSSAWAFHTRRQRGLKLPVSNLAPLAQLIELRMDLGAFRDDAHLASWCGKYEVSAHGWEILGKIWQQQSVGLDGLAADLERRGFSPKETAVALTQLCAQGWIQQRGENYYLTETGTAVREQAEQETDRFFYAPWSVLTVQELENLRSGLQELNEAKSLFRKSFL